MINLHRDHLLVLPEDDANRQFLTGLDFNPRIDPTRMHVLDPAGGWTDVLDAINREAKKNRIHQLGNRCQHLLLLIDFDDAVAARQQRYATLKSKLPPGCADRVYLLGSWKTPEKFKAACNYRDPLYKLGLALSSDCPPGANGLWTHAHLQHNAAELARLAAQVPPFLFRC